MTLNGESARADLAVSLAYGREPLVVGKEVIYTINVSNTGPGMAADVWLTDYPPSEIADPEFFMDGMDIFISWPDNWQLSLGDLEARTDRTVWIKGSLTSMPADVLLTNTVSVETSTTDPSPGNNLATDETIVLASALTADLSIVKASDSLEPLVGEEVVFTLTVANLGTDDANDIGVRDILPDGLSYISDDGQGAYDPVSGLWNLESLASGEEKILRITVQANQTGTLANTARIVASSATDDNYANNTSTRVIGLGTDYIDLALSTVLAPIDGADPDRLQNSDRFNFRVNLAYNNPSKASGITIQTSVPDGVGTAGSNPYPGCYDESTGIWYLDNADACASSGQSVDQDDEQNPTLDLEIKVLDISVISQAPVMATIRTADQPDPDTTNNSSCQILNRLDPFIVDLVIEVETDRTEVGPNEEVMLTITVRNTGPDTASGIRVKAVFPEELGYIGALSSQGAYDRETGIWSISVLKNNEPAEIQLKAVARVDSGQALFQAILSKVAEGEINLANNTDSVGLAIVGSGETPHGTQGGCGSGGCYLTILSE